MGDVFWYGGYFNKFNGGFDGLFGGEQAEQFQ
jgi:hypothetical protein